MSKPTDLEFLLRAIEGAGAASRTAGGPFLTVEPRAIVGELPRDASKKIIPTETDIDDRPWRDSSVDLAVGLEVSEVAIEEVDTTTGPGMQPLSEAEEQAWALGAKARADNLLPDASPYEAGSVLDLCWLEGFRARP